MYIFFISLTIAAVAEKHIATRIRTGEIISKSLIFLCLVAIEETVVFVPAYIILCVSKEEYFRG